MTYDKLHMAKNRAFICKRLIFYIRGQLLAPSLPVKTGRSLVCRSYKYLLCVDGSCLPVKLLIFQSLLLVRL